ncbi:universal stress protein [Natrinema caseinilyticum]|uniref:universal stress protein n=1 Tax=Natrinema caseinilyticum TaxID=2961570 RepID=UPI0020C2EC53|nr:universal stress protein [Natrinema caseinilyticum]
MTTRVLVAFDESTQANIALRYALSTHPGAEIHVLHVNDPEEWYRNEDLNEFYPEDSYEKSLEAAESLLERAEGIARESDADADVRTVSLDGDAASTIVTYAEDHDVDHIVVGSHGREGLVRYLLGSVAEHVVRRSHVPVTVIREERSS